MKSNEPALRRKMNTSTLGSRVSMAALAGSLVLTLPVMAQLGDHARPGFDRQLTLAPPDANSSGVGGAGDEYAKAKAAELVKKSLNPIASLISVPFQNNWDFGIGPSDAMKYTMNFQPVIPISLNKDWNVISRTILPTVYLESTAPGVGSKFGLGDTVQSLFLSPKNLPVVGLWARDQLCCCPRRRTAPSVRASGERAQPPSCCGRITGLPTGCSPTTSGHSKAGDHRT